ncbi:putative Cleavage and polyadenylation specificity factor subunit 4 [Paratrimastix pyriformis]|uniref:Cleavage and polyadenylation specificity factor subunit 4 n=1 Tax=Paratrimastix pyriformis TaxID=342808 RepID=A0ABQ8UPI3_9EUKA|nr:putative Cleavage and polyadenylation specificity factor subunit 4 [Paratrimastix pyriformis]
MYEATGQCGLVRDASTDQSGSSFEGDLPSSGDSGDKVVVQKGLDLALNLSTHLAGSASSTGDHIATARQTRPRPHWHRRGLMENDSKNDPLAVDEFLELDVEKAIKQHLFSKGKIRIQEVCRFFMKGSCPRGNDCPYRHIRPDKAVVCKHWWRSLCKKGDDCEFLHIFDRSRMPECWFFSRNGHCNNEECPFLHIRPEDKMKDCPECKNRHVRKQPCPLYMAGFCPDGPTCKFGHPKFELPQPDENVERRIRCHQCGQLGQDHPSPNYPAMAANCPNSSLGQAAQAAGMRMPPSYDSQHDEPSAPSESIALDTATAPGPPPGRPAPPPPQLMPPGPMGAGPGMLGPATGLPGVRRPLSEVVCFKCGQKGHFANRCPLSYTNQLRQAGMATGRPGGGMPNAPPVAGGPSGLSAQQQQQMQQLVAQLQMQQQQALHPPFGMPPPPR